MFQDGNLPSSSSCAPQHLHVEYKLEQEKWNRRYETLFKMRRFMKFSGLDRAEELKPDDDECQFPGEKKRRLNLEQVKALEKSFELSDKLEPERKMQLARALGLQPRQIAIWFQNKRARWKTKQMEKDYDVLKRQFELIKADNDALKSQNKKLQSQLLAMKSRECSGSMTMNLNKDNDDHQGCWSNGSSDDNNNNNCHVNLNTTSTASEENVVVFPSTIGPAGAAVLTQFLHSSPTANHNFSNMFINGLEKNQEYFWPWPQLQNFH